VIGSRSILTALRSAIERVAPRRRAPAGPAPTRPATVSGQARPETRNPSPGGSGSDATVEIDPATLGSPRWGYAPAPNGVLDPGEIVWTWVPYEERDGRGKDRPVIIMAASAGQRMLAVALTSTDHGDDADFVPLGVGPWDRERRPSWAGLDRVFMVSDGGVRREGAFVDRAGYTRVERALRSRYGWN